MKIRERPMPLILHIETSAKNCSVVLSNQGQCIFSKADTAGAAHAVRLGVFVDEALRFAEQAGLHPDAVAVSSGPGSYTGLRIGVSLAKGLCYALDLPLIAVPTLDLLVSEVLRQNKTGADDWVCPMVDARRMEVYTAFYNTKGERLQDVTAHIVDEHSFSAELSSRIIWFAGDAASKCQPVLKHFNARFLTDVTPLAEYMIQLAENYFEQKKFEDLAYFEPFYLKDFVATVSKKSIIPVPER